MQKSIYIIEFFGKKSDWECWLETFLSWGKRKSYKNLLIGEGSTKELGMIPMQENYGEAIEGSTGLNKKYFSYVI